jgi:hypothetical protein
MSNLRRVFTGDVLMMLSLVLDLPSSISEKSTQPQTANHQHSQITVRYSVTSSETALPSVSALTDVLTRGG